MAARAPIDTLPATMLTIRTAVLVALAFALPLMANPANSHADAAGFPGSLENYLSRTVKLTRNERQQLLSGQAVTKMLESDEKKAVAVFGAIWIDAPMRRYVDAVEHIETLERGGGFKITKRLSVPPVPDDFSRLQLPAEDLADLRRCRVGSCEVKLDEGAIRRFQSEIDWRGPNADAAANALMRQIALEYVTRYLAGGNAALPIYRDKSEARSVGEEFRSMVQETPELTTYMPSLREYLLHFPRVQLPGATSFLYWQETEFGLKPTIRISHLTIREDRENTVVTSQMLYATHYFWAALELRTLVADPSRGRGFWFVNVNRSRSDGLSGFTGLFVRRRVRKDVESGVLTALRSTKQRLERGGIADRKLQIEE
jgi:hypothetical protein